MFRPDRRVFSIASLALIVVAGLHSLGHFQPPPEDAAGRAVHAVMQGYRIQLGLGMEPSIFDITQALGLTMSLLLLFFGLQNLVVARAADATQALIRSLTLVSILATGSLVAVYAWYRIPPPLVSLAVVEALFVLALLLPRRRLSA